MKAEFTGLYDIRDYKAEDKAFVVMSFCNGVFYGDPKYKKVPKKSFMENYTKVAEKLIKDSVIKVACLKEDPDTILGYSILSADYLGIKWVYVKEKWRNYGIGRSLVPKYPVYVTHMTPIGEKLLTKFEATIYDPFKT